MDSAKSRSLEGDNVGPCCFGPNLPVVPDEDRQRPNHTPSASLFTMRDLWSKRGFMRQEA